MRTLLAVFLLLLAGQVQAEMVVVVNKDSPITSLELRDVANIFLAKSSHLESGERLMPIELDDDAARARFYKMICGKNLAQLNSYWTTLIFTGKGKPPRGLSSMRRLIELIDQDVHTITYLPEEAVTEQMRVVHSFR